MNIAAVEQRRSTRQDELDKAKTQRERNQLGQFATPSALAEDILRASLRFVPDANKIRFLDPAFGTGSFYSALLKTGGPERIASARGFEIDPHYGIPARALWESTPLQLMLADFTRQPAPLHESDKATLLVCNPPYVRHHHLTADDKARLRDLARQFTGISLHGLAGLYCYFLLTADAWLAEDGVSCWLIPGEFMDVNYGKGVKRYLLENVTLLRIHRFAPETAQFRDALVSSVVVWFRKGQPPMDHVVELSFGENLTTPERIQRIAHANMDEDEKWTRYFGAPQTLVQPGDAQKRIRLGELFEIKRGIATGANEFFVMTKREAEARGIPADFLKPILPSPRYLAENEVAVDEAGFPRLERQLVLLDCDLPEFVLREQYPMLWSYLQDGVRQGIDRRYLCRHRSPWYAQEKRPPAPIVCTYMGRQTSAKNERPFRFILNHSTATTANVYLMLYPKPRLSARLESEPTLLHDLWILLNKLSAEEMIGEGRTYGGSLHKIEPKELANAMLPDIFDFRDHSLRYEQLRLLERAADYRPES